MNIHTTLHVNVLLPRFGNAQEAIWLWIESIADVKEIVIHVTLSATTKVDTVRILGIVSGK